MSIYGKMRQKYGRFRKRRLFVFLTVFVVLLLISVLILSTLGIFGSRAELCTIRVEKDSRAVQSLTGTGINLDYIPLTNYIVDGSFESHNQYSSFHLMDAKGDKLLLDLNDVYNSSLDISSLSGCNVRIYTIDENGNTVLGVRAGVISYSPANFASYEEIEDTNWNWTQDQIVKVVECNNVTSCITTEGCLVSDIDSMELSKRTESEISTFSDLSASESSVFAVTKRGEIFYSTDGKSFSILTEFDSHDPYHADLSTGALECTQVAALKNGAIVLLSNGKVALCTYDGITLLENIDSKVADVINTKDHVYLFMENGAVYRSTNGLVFEEIEEAEEILKGRNIIASSASSNEVAVLLDGGTILLVNDEGQQVIEAQGDIKDICVTNNGELIVISSAGEAQLFMGTGFISLDFEVDRIFDGYEKELFVLRGNSIYKTSICSSIQIDQVIAEKTVFAGDVCFVEKHIPACSYSIPSDVENGDYWALSSAFDSWDAYGSGTAVSAIDGAPSGYGEKCARVLGISDNLHVLSQKIADNGSEIFNKNDFLRMELWLKQTNIDDKTVKIWLSSEGCKDIGFVVDDCKTSFSDYQNVFVASDEMINSKNEIRLNIAFEGTGELLIDGVYLGLDKYSSTVIPDTFSDAISSSAPNAIRLNNLRIGSDGVSYSSLFTSSANSNACVFDEEEGPRNSCASLEDSLRLVKESKAFPWLVLGSSVSSDMIDAFLEYMCGSLSSPYGKLRIDNGTAVPWSRQFSTIVIEINDTDGILSSDVQRSSYVNYVIGLIKQSNYYVDFKDNIIFVDGMNYEGGNMLSNADCHCSSYESDGLLPANLTFIDYINGEYVDINSATPRINSMGGDAAEFISSFDTYSAFDGKNMTAGESIVTLLSNESNFAGLVMVDIDCDRNIKDFDSIIADTDQTMLNCLNIVNDLKFSRKLTVNIQKPLQDQSSETIDSFNSNVGTYLFKTDTGYILIIANASDTQQQFLIDAVDLPLKGSVYTRYSATGEELQTQKMSNRHPRYTLQAGQVMVVKLEDK